MLNECEQKFVWWDEIPAEKVFLNEIGNQCAYFTGHMYAHGFDSVCDPQKYTQR